MHPRLKKRLGQNFLTDKNIIKKIVSGVSEFKQSETLIEIGAGSGLLTQPLLDIYQKVYAVEIDRELCAVLKNKFSFRKNFELVSQDFLKTDIREFSRDKVDVFGNIPYCITGPIFMKLFEAKEKINTVFITVQKEVAQRITAKPSSRIFGFFSCLVQYFTQLHKKVDIKKSSFRPMPKVDSAFLILKTKEPDLNQKEEAKFIEIIKHAFSQRRKTILNALSADFKKEELSVILKDSGINPKMRAEEICVDSYIELAKNLKSTQKLVSVTADTF